MIFKLFLILFLSSFLFASGPLIIDSSDTKIEDFNLEYYTDTTNSLDIKNVPGKTYKSISNMHSFGSKASTLWLKLELKNTSQNVQKVFLHDKFAYYSKEITVFEFENNNLLHTKVYDIFQAEDNPLSGKVLVYPLVLQATSSKTLYFKIIPSVSTMFDLNIYNEKKHTASLANTQLIANFMIIFLFSIALHNLILYIFNRKKEFLYYSLYLFNASLGFTYMYGSIFHNFHIYGEVVYWLNLTAIFVSLFLVLFIKSIFDFLAEKLTNFLLNSVIVFVILDVLTAIIIDLQVAINILQIIFLYSYIVVFYAGYTLYKQKHPLWILFITAFAIYILGFSINLSAMLGASGMTSFTFYASGMSLMLEAILFSYLLHYHVKHSSRKSNHNMKNLF